MRNLLCTIGLLLAGLPGFSQTKPAHPEMLVSTEWLGEHLKDPKLVILQFAKDQADFSSGHIPGARMVPANRLYIDKDGVYSELPPVDDLVKMFEELGVSNDSRIVIYTTDWPPMAPRVYFTLDYLGLGDHASLLDGGMDKWKSEKQVLSKDSTAVKPGKITAKVRPEILASLEDVKSAIAMDAAVVIDTRPDRRYESGHIPGSAHLYWKQTVTSGNDNQLLSPEEIQKSYAASGVKPGKKLVTYCEIGWQASHGYFTAKYLGYDVKMYDGSYREWNDVKHQPIVRGSSPR